MRVLGPFYSGEVLPPILVEQASHPCRASLSSLQSKFSETWWASLGLCPVRGPCEGWALPSLGLWSWAYWARQAISHILSSSFTNAYLILEIVTYILFQIRKYSYSLDNIYSEFFIWINILTTQNLNKLILNLDKYRI